MATIAIGQMDELRAEEVWRSGPAGLSSRVAAPLLAFLLIACAGSFARVRSDVSARPPRGATILFDGTAAVAQREWTHPNGHPFDWNLIDGAMEVAPRTGSIITRDSYGDFRLHLEFNLASMPNQHDQSRSNSGVHLHGLYEIQILDSVNNPTYKAGGCGSIYLQKDPDKNLCLPPGEWQTYDIRFRAPRFDSAGHVTEKPRVTVIWNGEKVHDNIEIERPTHAGSKAPMVATGPISLQDHGSPVRFRNIWIVVTKQGRTRAEEKTRGRKPNPIPPFLDPYES